MTEKVAALRGESTDNAVELRGRVSSAPVERELPSGAVITTFRLSVPRARTPDDVGVGAERRLGRLHGLGRPLPAQRERLGGGDEVEVGGALRRRFFRGGVGSSTRLEVEVLTARRARAREQPAG